MIVTKKYFTEYKNLNVYVYNRQKAKIENSLALYSVVIRIYM